MWTLGLHSKKLLMLGPIDIVHVMFSGWPTRRLVELHVGIFLHHTCSPYIKCSFRKCYEYFPLIFLL